MGLNDLHVALGGKMVPFAGYSMPLQYPMGVMKEHLHTRAAAGLFDVSHMGQVILRPKGAYEDTARAFEALMPVDVLGVKPGRQRYGLFTNAEGGILDDLMFANRGDHMFVVVNAACKEADIAHMQAHLAGVCEVIPVTDRALLAVQGPKAEAALARLVPEVAAMTFMDVGVFGDLWVSRSGYTGEDGFEISLPMARAEAFAVSLLDMPEVMPIGLGARDSLRLEAGLPLYCQEMDETITPVEAGQGWSIGRARRAGGARAGGFPGAAIILEQLAHGAPRRRVGLRPEGRAPMRAGVALFAEAEGGAQIGAITSGGFGPSLGGPMAIGLIDAATDTDSVIFGDLRGKRLALQQVSLPFVPPGYKR